MTILLILFTISVGYGQSKNIFTHLIKTYGDSIRFIQIKTDSVFNSNQIISLLILQKSFYNRFRIEFAYNQTNLQTTSLFAKRKKAEAAINGGFFNMDRGESVAYFEINDTVISRARVPNLKNILNGAIILTKDSKIAIQPAKSEQFYESSDQESAVLVTGPLLLFDSEIMNLPNTKFIVNRHPRTCLCISRESVVFITIDGRKNEAEGMNLIETQQFLSRIGCIDAINLDGGGSTTMWTNNKGIVNFPCDNSGERKVSNALLIIKK